MQKLTSHHPPSTCPFTLFATTQTPTTADCRVLWMHCMQLTTTPTNYTIQKSPKRRSRWWPVPIKGQAACRKHGLQVQTNFIWIMPWFIDWTIFKEIYPIAEVPLFTWMAASNSDLQQQILLCSERHSAASACTACRLMQPIHSPRTGTRTRSFARSSVRPYPRNISWFSSYSNSARPPALPCPPSQTK